MKYFLFLNLVFLTFAFNLHALAEGKAVGQLGLVEGEVFVDQKPVKKNALVQEGSTIEVKEGKATLLLGKGSVFHLAQNTRMVVNQFGVKPDTHEEGGELDLRFGRTRALILNQGAEKKDLRIKARAATMGVRGTEIFIDAPKDSSQPVQFFTLEGKADLKTSSQAPVVPVNQNQGVSSSGAGSANESAPTAVSASAVAEAKAEIKSSGMEVKSAGVVREQAVESSAIIATPLGIAVMPQIVFDPIQDRLSPIVLRPKFCQSTGAAGCN